MRLEQYRNEYIMHLKDMGRTESTQKRYSFDLDDFFLWCNVQSEIDQNYKLSTDTVHDYFTYLQNERAYSAASFKRIQTVLKQYFKYLVKKGYISKNLIPSIGGLDLGVKPFSDSDFVKESEIQQLLYTISSSFDLSEKQLKAHKYLKTRNTAILIIFIYYGLSLKELTNLTTLSVDFYQNKLHIQSDSSLSRTVDIKQEHKVTLFKYIESIPEPVRPKPKSDDPFFVAFDFARNTYRWDYSENKPKKLTEIAIQKMIRTELARAKLRPNISAQHLRRTAILNALKAKRDYDEINQKFGFKASNTLSRYINYLEGIEKTQATS